VGTTIDAVQRAVVGRELLGDLRRAKPALIFACLAWPLFGSVDVAHVHMGGHGDLGALLALRMIPMPWFIVSVWRVQRRPPISEGEFLVLVYGSIYLLLLTIALQCCVTGGLKSMYAEAIIAALAATTVVPRSWREHGPRMVAGAMIYPAVMIAGTFVWPEMRGQLESLEALYYFGAHLSMLWTTTLIVVLASHRLWWLRREVFETRSIGRYELRRRIGRGGMGEVWAAWHRGLEREVALKILRLSEDTDENAAARFEREVRLSSGLSHPHTVRLFDYGATEDGLLYYAMELLDGASLAELVRREGPMPAARVVHLTQQAARALAEAHERGIVHRDVKPENLFVTTAGGEHDFVKVLDYGIARVSSDAHLTQTGHVAGTPLAMSPEVIRGGPATPASDVYGLGVVMYFALTGQPPFGEARSSTLAAHLEDPVVPPSVRAPHDVPRDVEAIILRCLAKDPKDRYADGRALAEALADSSAAGTWKPSPSVLPPEPVPPSPDARTRIGRRLRKRAS
jgi:hypothetical protein